MKNPLQMWDGLSRNGKIAVVVGVLAITAFLAYRRKQAADAAATSQTSTDSTGSDTTSSDTSSTDGTGTDTSSYDTNAYDSSMNPYDTGGYGGYSDGYGDGSGYAGGYGGGGGGGYVSPYGADGNIYNPNVGGVPPQETVNVNLPPGSPTSGGGMPARNPSAHTIPKKHHRKHPAKHTPTHNKRTTKHHERKRTTTRR